MNIDLQTKISFRGNVDLNNNASQLPMSDLLDSMVLTLPFPLDSGVQDFPL